MTTPALTEEDTIHLSVGVPAALAAALVEQATVRVLGRIEDRSSYMGTTEVAAYLGMSKKRIDNLCAQQRIPFRKDGGRRIFIRHEIDQWVEQLEGPTVQVALAASGGSPLNFNKRRIAMQDTHDWLLANGWVQVPHEYGGWIHPVTHDAATPPYHEEEAVEAMVEQAKDFEEYENA